MDLSIVIPAYDEEHYIGHCLEAVSQELARLDRRYRVEVIVVDNASRDATGEIVSEWANVRLVREPAKGLTKARQRGLEAAKGHIVAYIDADTRMPDGWMTTVLERFSADPSLVCLSGPYRYYDAAWPTRALVFLYWRILALPVYLVVRYMAVGGNFAARKWALEKISGFDTRIAFYGEDTNIARRLAAVGNVRFTLRLPMYTSARRLRALGTVRMAAVYALNYLSEVILRRPLTIRYDDIR